MKVSFWVKSGRVLGGSVALLMLLGLAGCTPGKSTVSGTVYFKKKPLKGGTVLFFSEGKGSRTAKIGEDGSYKIEDMPSGNVKISVETESAKKAAAPPRNMPLPPKDANLPPEAAGNPAYSKSDPSSGNRYQKIPPKYGKPNESGLTFEVTGGNVTHDIELD